MGDGSEYFDNPSSKAFRVRLKFLNNNFLQGVTEDFMAIQNLERNADATITTTDQMFRQFEIYDPQEQQLVVRLVRLPQPRARPSEIAASVVSVERTLAILDDFTVMDRGPISIIIHNPIFADTYIHAVPDSDSQ